MLGESMAMNVDDLVYALMNTASGVGPTMDSVSFGDTGAAKALFATDRADGGNLYVNAAAPLSSASLSHVKSLMRLLKSNGRAINMMPRYLIVPAALEQTALGLINSSLLITGSTTTTTDGNTHKGSLTVIVEPRLDGNTNGTTAWYLAAQAGARAEHIAISFLRGQETPTIERMQMQSPLALGWLAYHDVGVSAIDWRGIVRSKGAA